ncbi:helix-turn-helix domain-containing protein [Lacticaseibacillus nasuensis]|uniref:helix-turn-helix domain-containing protein n=1 Tax=Lacticaseibacillus nasuensis TaxID=944671 RepID=UPI00158498B9|nr:helix-turn-helix transcriptional regulator [Lacticaseibacillus nasuensis]
MIIIKLDELLARRHMTLTALADAVDITVANLSILKTGKGKAIRFSTLGRLCAVLQCQPGELLAYVPGDEKKRQALRLAAWLFYSSTYWAMT